MTKILIIEDTGDLREDIIEMLSLEGYTVLGADNGQTGVELAQQHKPDLVVCDVMMPEMDGYQVLEELRRNPATATIPFIFLTARTERINIRHGMVLGADDYLTKPFLVNELLESIRSQLAKRSEFNKNAEQRLNELRETIITALPHELRTPLNAILGFSEMLLMEAQRLKPDQVADWAGHIHQAAQRLYRLVENYLYFAQLQVKDVHDLMDDAQPSSIADAHHLCATLALKTSQRYKRETDLVLQIEEASHALQCRYRDFVKVVDELVDNAFKFSEVGERVTVIGQPSTTGYRLCIMDEGRGIEPEQLTQIGAYMQFGRWFYEQQGMGLGLAIARQIAHLYGSSLDITSEIGRGTRICLTFPYP